LDSRLFNRQLQYLVSFKGYGPEENLWLAERNINAPRLISQFHRKHPSAPRRISAIAFQALPFQRYGQPPSGNIFDWHSSKLVETPSLNRGVM
jgi:hypothetical protein